MPSISPSRPTERSRSERPPRSAPFMGSRLPRLAVGLSVLAAGCGTKRPDIVYVPPPDRVYDVDSDRALEAVLAGFQELGFVVDNVGGLEGMSVITSAERASEPGEEDGLECQREWKGLALGGWVEEIGGVVLTAQLSQRNEGTSIRLRETGVGGCVPTGHWGERFFQSIESQLGEGRAAGEDGLR